MLAWFRERRAPRRPGHSGAIPAFLATPAHLAICSLMNAANSAGELPTGSVFLRLDPANGRVADYRRFTGRTSGIAVAADGSVFGAQEGGRRAPVPRRVNRLLRAVSQVGSARDHAIAARTCGRITSMPQSAIRMRSGRSRPPSFTRVAD